MHLEHTAPTPGTVFTNPRGRRYKVLSTDGTRGVLWDETFRIEETCFWPLMTPENGWTRVQ